MLDKLGDQAVAAAALGRLSGRFGAGFAGRTA
jgi:hypothetical protein